MSRRPTARRPGRWVMGEAPPGTPPAPDVTAPVLVSIIIPTNGLTAAFLYDEALDTGSTPAAGAYTFSGTSSTAASVAIVGDTVTVTFDTAVLSGETVLASYTAGGAPVQDISGNDAANLTNNAVTNNSTAGGGDVTSPTLVSITIATNGLTAAFLYNEALDTGSVPATGAFSFSGTSSTASSVGVAGSTVTVTFNTAVGIGQTVLASYTAGGAPTQDSAGNDAANLTNNATTNNSTVDITAPTLSSAVIDAAGTTITLTYNETLAATTPAAGAFSLSATTLTSAVTAVGTPSGSAIALTVAPPILLGEAPTLNYTAGGSPIEDTAGNNAANLSAQALTNNSTARTDLVVITRFSSTTGNYPASVYGTALKRCWGGGGGGTTNVTSGGCGAFAEDAAYVYTANEAWNITVGAGGAAAGGTGGDTSIDSSCIAKGAVGVTGGLSAGSAGTTIRAGNNGSVVSGNTAGAASHGSASAAAGLVPGEPQGAPTATGISTPGKTPSTGGRATTSAQSAGGAGLAELRYLQAALANFPGLVDIETTRTTGTSHTGITVPAGAVGDELLYIVISDGAPTITISGGTSICTSSAADGKLEVFRRTADNSTDPTTVTTSASESITTVVARFNAAGAAEGTASFGNSTGAAVPGHTPSGGNGNYKVLTILGRGSTTTNNNITARPAGFDYSVFAPAQNVAATASAFDICVTWQDAAVVGAAGSGTWAHGGADWCAATVTMAKV